MPDMEICYNPIGIVHSPFKKPEGTPIQAAAAKGVKGLVEIFPEYVDGLKDLDGFSHIILIYHFHLARKKLLLVKPFLDDELRGVFATRAPSRPNPIGLSVVKLNGVEENILYIENVDILDGTPLLDIKPCIPEFDFCRVERTGWIEKRIHRMDSRKDDGRFSKI